MRDRTEWLLERRKGIGGSDAAAVLGISPWATPVTVWLDKTGRAAPQEETEAMRIGTELEDFVARRYAMESGRTVQRYNTMLHKGCLLGNIDRLVVMPDQKVASHQGEIRTDTLLECKTASQDWNDGVPLYYQTQVQHYMGLDEKLLHADVGCLFLGRHKHFQTYRVERDDEVIAYMQARLTEWWQEYVVGNKMPPPKNEADCKLLWARSNPGKSVQSTAEIKATVERLSELKATEKQLKADIDAAQSDICAVMGEAEILADESGKPLVTWKSPAKDTAKVNWEQLARHIYAQNHVASIPEEYIAKFTETKPGARRFLVKI